MKSSLAAVVSRFCHYLDVFLYVCYQIKALLEMLLLSTVVRANDAFKVAAVGCAIFNTKRTSFVVSNVFCGTQFTYQCPTKEILTGWLKQVFKALGCQQFCFQ